MFFFGKKLVLLIPTFFGISLLAFLFIHLLPGDPVLIATGERNISKEKHDEFISNLGLDKPLPIQYLIYIKNIARGDFGTSISTQKPVWNEFKELFPATLELALCSIFIALFLGLPAGILSAVYKNKLPDRLIMTASLLGYSMPIFWWGLLMILFFSNYLAILPVSGRISFEYFIAPRTGFLLIDSLIYGEKGAFTSAAQHLILPSLVLSTIPLAVIARQTRAVMLEVMGEDYIRTAKAKGLSARRILFLHALRNALIPIVTVIGLQVGVLFTGAILTENIFSWPGIGKWMVDSIFRRDYPVLQSGLLILGFVVMGVNFLVDMAYYLINPRL